MLLQVQLRRSPQLPLFLRRDKGSGRGERTPPAELDLYKGQHPVLLRHDVQLPKTAAVVARQHRPSLPLQVAGYQLLPPPTQAAGLSPAFHSFFK